MTLRMRLVLLGVPLVLGSCSLAPEYRAPDIAVPAAYDAGPQAPASDPSAAAAIAAEWWREFGSAELDALVSEALAANYDIEAAKQRIEQARATRRAAGSALLPSIDAGGSAARSRSSGGTDRGLATTYKGTLEISYEADLWGANRNALASAEATHLANRYALEASSLVVQSEVVSSYVQALALRDRLRIAAENLSAARQILDVVRVRVREGFTSPLDLAQQEGNVATIEASIPVLDQELRAALTSLAILLGRAPQGFTIEATSLSSLTLPEPAAGQPSDLLVRRPDVRQTEAALRAANADIGVARAAFLPTITLSAGDALTSIASGGTTTMASLASGLALPIFTGGRLDAEVERTRSRFAELVAGYRQAVLVALKEAQDGLVAMDASGRRTASLGLAAERAAEASRIANDQYAIGTGDFMSVLDSQRSLLSAQDSHVQAQSSRYLAALDLYKALGGGWRLPDEDSAQPF